MTSSTLLFVFFNFSSAATAAFLPRRVRLGVPQLACRRHRFHPPSLEETQQLQPRQSLSLSSWSTTLSAVKKTSSSSSSSSLSRSKRVAALLEWCNTVGIASADTRIQLGQDAYGGLGWFAAASDATTNTPGSVLLSVPAGVALTVEQPGDGPDDGARVQQALQIDNRKVFETLPWYVKMSLYLYKLDRMDSGKGKGIDLRPWLDSLPRTFDTPIHWSTSTLQSDLQYPFLVNAVTRQENAWKRYYQQFLSTTSLPESQRPTWDDFLWGCECARSRAFSGAYTGSAFNPLIYVFTLFLVTAYVGLHLGTLEQAANGAGVVLSATILKDFVVPKLLKTKRYVICPMIDMTNHQSVDACAEVSFEFFGNAYSLALSRGASRLPAAGDEITISYGARSNDQLLQYYGFVEADNPHDVYILPPLREWDIDALEQACGRQFAPGRLEKLDRAGLLGSTSSRRSEPDQQQEDDGGMEQSGVDAANVAGGVVVTRAIGLDPAVLQALRALVSTEEEWKAAGQAVGSFAEPRSPENEQCARLVAKTALELELASKATSLDEDHEMLKRMDAIKSMDASREERLAILFRIEKKKLLMEVIKNFS